MSVFERLPNEVLNQICEHVEDDSDLVSLFQACKTFARALMPGESAIWKARFLQRYDRPDINGTLQYRLAYQIRQVVLKRVRTPYKDPKDLRVREVLHVFQDMVKEAYRPASAKSPPESSSKNLAAFEHPSSPWILAFISTPFFPAPRGSFGQPDELFDALQLTLSHLVLSPGSLVAQTTAPHQEYDLAVVYNWDRAFNTLYFRSEEPVHAILPPRSRLFPLLRRRDQQSREPRVRFVLDLHSALHIRNFWHRHLTDPRAGYENFRATLTGKGTYAGMAKDLMDNGRTPRHWENPLGQDTLDLATVWYGHYSCLHPWPKSRRDLEERETCAEDWNNVDHMKLEFTIHNNNNSGAWSAIFNSIPAFVKTLPDLSSPSCRFIKGLSRFVDFSSDPFDQSVSMAKKPLSTESAALSKYHPFKALRARGIIHSIPNQPLEAGDTAHSSYAEIPGWNRVVMILYRPTTLYLIRVLERAEQEPSHGLPPGPPIPDHILWNLGLLQQAPVGVNIITDEEVQKFLEDHLDRKLMGLTKWHAANMGRPAIEKLEMSYMNGSGLDWQDIEAAFAYEGLIIPGGKIMMGRYWRMGEFGVGDGLELDAYGMPLPPEVQPDQEGTAQHQDPDPMDVDTDPAPRRPPQPTTQYERGPFVFWC